MSWSLAVSNRNELSKWRANAKSDKAAAFVSDKMSLCHLHAGQCTVLTGIMADLRVTGESLNMFNPTPHPFPGRGGEKRKMAGKK